MAREHHPDQDADSDLYTPTFYSWAGLSVVGIAFALEHGVASQQITEFSAVSGTIGGVALGVCLSMYAIHDEKQKEQQ